MNPPLPLASVVSGVSRPPPEYRCRANCSAKSIDAWTVAVGDGEASPIPMEDVDACGCMGKHGKAWENLDTMGTLGL